MKSRRILLVGFGFLVVCVLVGWSAVSLLSNEEDSSLETEGGTERRLTRPDLRTFAQGILVGEAELRRRRTGNDSAWTDLVSRVDEGVDDEDLSIEVDSEAPSLVYGAALIWARTHDDLPAGWKRSQVEGYRKTVRAKLADLIAIPFDTTASATRPARRIGAYVLAADLIDLPALDPELDAKFQRWLRVALYLNRSEGFLPSVWENAMRGVGNTGFAARFSAAAALVYLDDRDALDELWLSWRRIFDNSIDHKFAWATGDAHGSWQDDPDATDTSTWYGVLPRIRRDDNEMSGIIPADIRRSSDSSRTPEDRFNYYDPDDFPGGMYSNYHHLSSHALLLAAEILHRAGYPARTFADEGPLRVAQMLHRFSDEYGEEVYGRYGWRYFNTNSGHEQQVYLINSMYPGANFPDAGDGQRPTHLLGFHRFTHRDGGQ